MRKHRKTKGQVSIFLVFLFQVLFVFFAMVVNVGLLVYYKINLQNSVDLAAYYAAMKQAEMLNTIGHINYQIRQSWKLLAYRATILGTLGPDSHPARPLQVGTAIFKQPPPEVQYMRGNPPEPIVPVFCVTVSNLYGNIVGNSGAKMNEDDNQCRKDEENKLSGFHIPDVIWSLPGFNEKIRDGAIGLQDKFLQEFSGGGFRNYQTLAAFILLFRADSLNRRKVIATLANTLSKSTDDFYDIDNASVAAGAGKVLTKNLAEENNSGLSMALYNSLANPGCGGANSDIEALPPWLKEIELAVMFAYLDSSIDSNTNNASIPANQKIHLLGFEGNISLPEEIANQPAAIKAAFEQINELTRLDGLPQHPAGRWTTAIGVEKNPWCMPYIGFKAASKPRLPFMPSRFAPTLQAKGFAKPFGSRIGPWYGRSWPDGAPGTTSDKNPQLITDLRLPPRLFDGASGLPPLKGKDVIRYFPNYGRFVGDQLGLLSEAARFGYGKFYWMPHPNNPYMTAMWKVPLIEAFQKNRDVSSPFFMGPMSGDILADAYNPAYFPAPILTNSLKFAKEMRISELAAIAPDIFDITYYTIEPRFNQYLLPRLKEFVSKQNSKRQNLMVRGDLGWRDTGYNGEPGIADESVNVENQIALFKDHDFYKSTKDQIFQIVTDPAQLLTSWAETSIIDYDANLVTNKIGKCHDGSRVPAGAEPWTPGACVKGGRTGYSVKLVSKKFLLNDIPDIGGTGVSGSITNKPDPDF